MVDYSRYQYLKVEKAEGVATVTLNRPERLNAIDRQLHEELEDVLVDLGRDEEVNAIVLTGAGRAFSAGGDIRGMQERLKEPPLKHIPTGRGRRIILNLLELDKPIIAAVNGDAVGLGATVALFCDVIIASETARIGDPHVRVGLVAGDGGAVIWPLLVGVARAKEFLMTGDLIPAREAERMGLVNRVVPAEQVLPEAMELAKRLASGPTWAIRWTKFSINKLLRAHMNLILDTSLALEGLTMLSEDHKEAVNAFLEKRRPSFKGL
jgi:enoyl-CoA hydratase